MGICVCIARPEQEPSPQYTKIVTILPQLWKYYLTLNIILIKGSKAKAY